MVLTVNGERHEVAASTVKALLDELEYDGGFVVVAVNHDVVTRTRWDDTPLSDGDRVEIVTPRQGG